MRATVLKNDGEKRRLIHRLSAEHVPLMIFYEEDPGENVPHQNLGRYVNVVHPPYDYDTLHQWLYLGNWQAVFPANKDYVPLDTFRAKHAEIRERMNRFRVKLILDSFHDDTEWHFLELTCPA